MDWKKKAKAAKAEWEAANGGGGGGAGGAKAALQGAVMGGGGGGAAAAAADEGPEQYGSAVDGVWKNAKVPPHVAGYAPRRAILALIC